jgi:hypothetical protein
VEAVFGFDSMKRSFQISDTGSTPVGSTKAGVKIRLLGFFAAKWLKMPPALLGPSRLRRSFDCGVENQGWRGTLRHANVTAKNTGKVLQFPARTAVAAMPLAA